MSLTHISAGQPSFRIENNPGLIDLQTPDKVIIALPTDAIVEVYYYGNGRGEDKHSGGEQPFSNVYKLCPVKDGCHVAEDTECSRLEEPITNVEEFVRKCSHKKVIKGAPGVKLELDLATLNANQIDGLFNTTKDIHMCITATGTYHKKIRFPQLAHIESCERGENALLIENNPFLENVLLPCVFSHDGSFRIRGNTILNPRNIKSILTICVQCDLQDPGVCDHYPFPRTEEEYKRLSNVCQGVKTLFFDSPDSEIFDASLISQFDFEQLFKNVEEVNFLFYIVNTTYTRLAIPNLKTFHVNGGNIMTIEENEFMRELISHYNIDVDVEDAAVTAKLSRNRWISEKFVDKWKRRFCRGNVACEISLYVDCSNVDSLDTKEIVEKCTGAKIIKPKPGVDLHLDMKGIMHDEAFDFFENLEEVHMCISVVETDYDSLNMSSLKKFIPCKSQKNALVVKNNEKLTTLFFNSKLVIPSTSVIRGNPKLLESNLRKLRRKCLRCDIQLFGEAPI